MCTGQNVLGAKFGDFVGIHFGASQKSRASFVHTGHFNVEMLNVSKQFIAHGQQ
jgi:hypothetical protein